MKVIAFSADHLGVLRVQEAQLAELALATPDLVSTMERANAWTIIEGSQPLFCGGIVDGESNVSGLWAFVSKDAGARMVVITRMVRRFFSMTPRARIETYVADNFAAAARWATMLGFRKESHIAGLVIGGTSYDLYARIS